jgi:hypothetical protein
MRRRPIGRQALSFVPAIAIIGGVLLLLPLLASRVVSWSWIWLFCYVPVWTVFLWSCAAATALVSASRLVRLLSGHRASP